MKQLLILGAAGTGEDVAGFLGDINEGGPTYECLGFLDDDEAKHGRTIAGYPVLGPLSRVAEHPDVSLVNCLGGPRSFLQRQGLMRKLGIDDERCETIVHPSTIVAPGCHVGRGCILYPFTHLGPRVVLGTQVIVLSHSSVHHHSRIGAFSIIAGGCQVSGGVTIGESSYLGTGCTVRDGITVGAQCMIGMGSAVVDDVSPQSIVVGVPARAVSSSD